MADARIWLLLLFLLLVIALRFVISRASGSEEESSNDGALDDGALDDGALDDGALDDGALDDGALDDGLYRHLPSVRKAPSDASSLLTTMPGHFGIAQAKSVCDDIPSCYTIVYSHDDDKYRLYTRDDASTASVSTDFDTYTKGLDDYRHNVAGANYWKWCEQGSDRGWCGVDDFRVACPEFCPVRFLRTPNTIVESSDRPAIGTYPASDINRAFEECSRDPTCQYVAQRDRDVVQTYPKTRLKLMNSKGATIFRKDVI